MKVSANRSWVPLHVRHTDAVARAIWGCQENGISVCDPKKEIVLLEVRISALGVGHYLMCMELTTHNWNQFRFYGNLPLQSINENGHTLLEVNSNVLAII